MPRAFKTSILTANDLLSGEVVYYQGAQKWSPNLQDAQVFKFEEEAETALKSVHENEVVGAYLSEVSVNDNIISTLHFRETFRATGPSNYYHGKQTHVSV